MFHPNMSPVVPLAMYVALGYLVAQLFMNVFLMAVDTILQCYIKLEEQEEVEAGFVPAAFKGFVKESVAKKEVAI